MPSNTGMIVLSDLIRQYKVEKLTLRQLATKYGVTWQAVHDRLTRAGVPMRSRTKPKRQLNVQRLIRLYCEDGLTAHQIAVRMKTNPGRVYSELESAGIGRHPRGSRPKGRYRSILRGLQEGESVVVPAPQAKYPHSSLHASAKKVGVSISVKKLGRRMRITRVSVPSRLDTGRSP
jgi:hypothetical protein